MQKRDLQETTALPDAGVVLLVMAPELLEFAETPAGESTLEAIKNWFDGEKKHLILVLAEACEWEEAGWLGLQMVPANEVPLNNTRFWGDETHAFSTIQKDLQDLMARNTEINENQDYFEDRVKKMQQEGGPSPMKFARTMMWKSIPKGVKWGVAVILGSLAAWAAYQIF